MARIRVTSPEGKEGSIDESNLDAARQEGYKPITQATEYAKTPEGKVKTAAEGLARGLTFGGSDVLIPDKALAQTLREENPGLSISTDLIGNALGPGKFLGAAGKLAAPAEDLASTVGRQFISNGLNSLSPVVTENVLEHKEITAENLGARLITGTVFGTGVDKGANLLGRGARAAANMAASNVTGETLNNLAKEGSKAAYKAAVEDLTPYISKEGVDRSPEELLNWAKTNGLIGADPNATAGLARGRMKEAKDSLTDYLRIATDTAPTDFGHFERQDIMAKIQGLADDKTGREKTLKLLESEYFPKGTANIVEAHMDDYSRAKALADAANDKAASLNFDMSKVSGGGMFGMLTGNIGRGLKIPFVDYAARNVAARAGPLIGKSLDDMVEGNVFPRVADAFKDRVEQMLATAPSILEPYTQALNSAVTKGSTDLIATHLNLMNSPQGGDYLSKMGMTPHEQDVTSKFNTLNELSSSTGKFRSQTARAIDRFLSSKGGEAPPSIDANAGMVDSHLEALKNMVNDTQGLAGKLPERLMNHAPGMAVSLAQQAVNGAQFLIQRAPQPPDMWKPKALREPYEASQQEVDRWYRYVDAVSDPSRLTHELASGNIRPETVETVKALYPAIFEDMQKKIMEKMQTLEKIPYQKKLQLSNAFGVELLGFSPAQVILMQDAHNMASQQPPQGGTPDGRQMVDSNKNEETQSQRLENRGIK